MDVDIKVDDQQADDEEIKDEELSDEDKVIVDKKELELSQNPEFRSWLVRLRAQVSLLTLLENVTQENAEDDDDFESVDSMQEDDEKVVDLDQDYSKIFLPALPLILKCSIVTKHYLNIPQ